MEHIWKEIPLSDIEGFIFGSAEDQEGGTGCTVMLCEKGAVTGCDVRGGAPASRENALLAPLAANDAVHAVLLAGGSAFGLNAAAGVMRWLEERSIGFPTSSGVVPIVVASCLFDLSFKDPKCRPDEAMGYQACENAGNLREGSHGAGTGATCGKPAGMERAMKSGLGAFALQYGDLKVGALFAANPLGNICDPDTGEVIAGVRGDDGGFLSAEDALLQLDGSLFTRENTTIGIIITNGIFNKTELCKIAGMAHDGLARAIRPVHTMFDGDTVYASAAGTVKADINSAGTLAAVAGARAIKRAALCAEAAGGLPGACSRAG